jgi:integrase
VSVSDETINDVARNLRRQEAAGRLRDSKTRARFLVRATTGRRAAEVKAARVEDVQLDRRLWFVRTAKGGLNSVIILNDEMVGAWQLFSDADAWGWFDDRSFSKTLKRNGWPRHIPPKNLRHSTAIAIRARGGDLGDVKDQLGHASLQTTEENYLHVLPARQAETSARLAGRFHAVGFQALPRTTPTTRQRRDAKALENPRKIETA